MITQDQLKEVLDYNPETGVLTWKITRGRATAGNEAGTLNKSGYVNIKINGRVYKAHRLAYLYVHGYTPNEVGHDNQNCSDNRILNLIDLSHAENMKNKKVYKNNKSGVPGVTWHKKIKQWQVHIRVNDKSIHLGYFKELNEAVEVRNKAKADCNFHVNHA